MISRNIPTRILHYIHSNQSNSHTEPREQASKKPLCPKPNFQAQIAVPVKKSVTYSNFPLTSSQSIRYNVTFRDGWLGVFLHAYQAFRFKRTVTKKQMTRVKQAKARMLYAQDVERAGIGRRLINTLARRSSGQKVVWCYEIMAIS